MNSNLITLISSFGAAILGALVGFAGVKTQMNYEKSLRKREEKVKLRKLNKIITMFLKEEIINNFRVILGDLSKNQFKECLNDSPETSKINFLQISKIRFREFESIKHELLTSNINEGEKIIDLYVMFKILQDNESMQKLNQEQYNFVKQTYLNNVNSYIN